jgi:DNA invertase Pin-like site-specific DNA recombinase
MTPTAASSARRTRVLLYARTSTPRDQSPASQLDAMRQVAEQRGWEIAGEYVDAGQSGSKDRRPQLDELMRHVHRGDGVRAVIVFRFDRFARSVRHLVMALDDFRARGIDFVSINDSIDTSTPTGRFTFSVIAAVAELEREIVRERTRCGLDAARRRGAKIGRPRVVVDLSLAGQLRAGGLSLRAAARKMKIGAATLQRALNVAAQVGADTDASEAAAE